MKKFLQTITSMLLICAIACVFPFNFSSFAYGTDNISEATENQDLSELKNALAEMEKYIDISNAGYFNYDMAIEDGASAEILEAGNYYNEMLYAEKIGDYKKVEAMRMDIMNITKYGNWCGSGNNGKAPIDVLDAQCKKHDKCYSAYGQWNTACDVEFVHNLCKNFGSIKKLGAGATAYAICAIAIFGTKAGGTAYLKTKYPIIAPFLP